MRTTFMSAVIFYACTKKKKKEYIEIEIGNKLEGNK